MFFSEARGEESVTEIWRWLLAPVSQWRAYRLVSDHGPSMSYQMAWSLVVLARDPASLPYVRRQAFNKEETDGRVGVILDVWIQLSRLEKNRRLRWLKRHSETPLYRLGITEELIELAGLSVMEWSLPPGCQATSIVVQQRGMRPE